MHGSKQSKAAIARGVIIACALVFLYLPIVTLIVYSFNESRMVTVWTQASLKWYRALFNNSDIIRAVGVSLLVAFMTACASVVLGTLAAFVLTRVGSFRGESLFVLLMTAPMVLPEVITGLALLLIFVTLGSHIPIFADRGIWAIWIAHVTFCSAYATVVIRSRFRELDTSIEEAAMDLGAGPVKVFFAIILPALMPSEVAAFLLAFTMSMDDLVIASFIAGPDSTTLPMLIFSSVRRGLSPEINALATIIVFIVSIFTFFAWLSMVKKQKRKRADAAKAEKASAEEQKLHYFAPHGDEILDSDFKLNPVALALLQAQAKALSRGEDTAAATALALKSMRSPNVVDTKGRKAGAVVAAEDGEAVDNTELAEAYATAAEQALERVEREEAEAALREAQVQQSKAEPSTVAVSPVVTEEQAAKLEAARKAASEAASAEVKKSSSSSAKDATAAQRIESEGIAQAGMARVLDHEEFGEVKFNPSNGEDQDLIAPAPTSMKAKLKGATAPATTSTSLADAKARKAATKAAISKAQSSETESNDSLEVASDKSNAKSSVVATTASSLAQSKARKAAAAAARARTLASSDSDNKSASEVTNTASTDIASANVIDNTDK
ncbi:MAG: ABC transporter permease subunit [Anaerobiospirillum succiniciproducens]|uniref:ABC transporter permease subunit n=1 Tax=Anaerobiospirillum succiniciproducens TaxID=13335 RepID=UPI002A74B3A6|nr:ABC transporter permease subunit [Anaerobiospirillum succiniciproducens]MDY2798402.1 ABC transporter permease subunit [Anaerobiospirillum succiniciproducens]